MQTGANFESLGQTMAGGDAADMNRFQALEAYGLLAEYLEFLAAQASGQ